MYKKCVLFLLCFAILLPLLPTILVTAAYDNGYSGTMAGEGTGIYAHGLDLSEWQGHEVDFHKIKEQGYSFVILRAGFASTIDDCFEENYARAKEAGLNVGVYLYSYADNTEEAQQEAQAMLGWLSGKTLEYPVYYDLEDPKCHGDMSVEQLTEIAFTFLEMLSSEGWLVGIYSCKSWLENKFDLAAIGSTYECWMAQFVSSGTYDIYDRYDEVYGMWQYSCTGQVDGVPGGVDMNVCFKDYPAICKQYGFNGYSASDASIVLNGASIPELLTLGESIEVKGRVTSTKGNLTNVTVGIYSMEGKMLTGKSAAARDTSYDVSALSYGVRAENLPEGTYIYRISASNMYETCILLNRTIAISETGISLIDVSLPEHFKQGQEYELSGTVLCANPMKSISLTVKDKSGTLVLHDQAKPNGTRFDLSRLQANFAELMVGEYRMVLEAVTDAGVYYPMDVRFSVWAANDPVRLEQFRLQATYFPGELTELNGMIVSTSSKLRQIDIELLDNEGNVLNRIISQPMKKQVSLADYDHRLGLAQLPIGIYRLRVSALNDGGPQILLDYRFLIREDGLSLCDFNAPNTLYYKDSYFLQGAVCSDVTSLSYVGVNVTDAKGFLVLSAAAIPHGNLFELSDLNDSLEFSSLACGAYNLMVTAENEYGGAVLYHAAFYVVEHEDVISWSEPCSAPDRISYSTVSSYYLNGKLSSSESIITHVRAEILSSDGQLYSSAEQSSFGKTFSLEKWNETLRFSALPVGNYVLRIEASNESGTFEMLRSAFTVSECKHSNVRSGQILSADCGTCGAVADSRCMDCGDKVRNGFLLETEDHVYEQGRCTRCGTVAYITVTAERNTQPLSRWERYVIAYREGDAWYALSSDGSTVIISAPDAFGRVELSAEYLWQFVSYENGYGIRAPRGAFLHLDRSTIAVAGGTANGIYTLAEQENAYTLCLADAPHRGLSFTDGAFYSGENATEIVLFRLITENN